MILIQNTTGATINYSRLYEKIFFADFSYWEA
jgi:hypothetical protein